MIFFWGGKGGWFCQQVGSVGGKRGGTHQMRVSWENQGSEETGNVGVNRIYT